VTYLAARFGWSMPFYLTSALCVIAALLFLKIDATRKIARNAAGAA